MDSLAKRRKKPDGPMAALGYARKSRPSAARPAGKRMRELRAGENMGYDEGHLAVVTALKMGISFKSRLLDRLKSLDPEIVARAVSCFDSPAGAASWLTRPQYGLNGLIPVEMPRTAATKRELMKLLTRIDYGVLS
jgi:hypothetical protein